MRKGVVEEMFGFLIIALAIILVIVIYITGTATKDVALAKQRQGALLDEETNNLLHSIYDIKLSVFDKTYAEILVDANLQGKNMTQVYYGQGLGTIDVGELIGPVFDANFGKGKWALVVSTPKGNATYNDISGKNYVYDYPIPAPSPEGGPSMNRLIMYIDK
jgi:hypothetical protein